MATSLELPSKLEDLLDYLVQEGHYSSKSEGIRDSIRQQHSEILDKIEAGDVRVKTDEL